LLFSYWRIKTVFKKKSKLQVQEWAILLTSQMAHQEFCFVPARITGTQKKEIKDDTNIIMRLTRCAYLSLTDEFPFFIPKQQYLYISIIIRNLRFKK
jgi:hypothetical protein